MSSTKASTSISNMMIQDDFLSNGSPAHTCHHQRSHGSLVVAEWDKLRKQIEHKTTVLVDGSSLDMASITAVARYGQSYSLAKWIED